VGAWFALALGVAELLGLAALKFVMHKYVHYDMNQFWAAPIANFIVFLPFIAGLMVVARRRGRDFAFKWTIAILGALSAYGALLNLPRLSEWAVGILAIGIGVQAYRMSGWLARRIGRPMRITIWPMGALFVAVFAWIMVSPIMRERGLLAALPEPPADAPNVLLLILDTVRARNMSLYGYDQATSPRMAEFATDGVVFDRAISPAPWTLPSHASMLTGHWPDELGVGWGSPYDGRYPLISEALEKRGYATGAFTANSHYLTAESGLDRGFSRFRSDRFTPEMFVWGSTLGRRILRLPFILPLLDWNDRPGRKTAAHVGRELLDWLDTDEHRPFFAMLNYYDAHHPYGPPAPYDSIFGSRGLHFNHNLEQTDSLPASAGLDEEKAYNGSLAYLDHEIGGLLDSLDARGKLRNTIVIITSDHGEEFAEHGWLGHGNDLYLPSLHVPLIVVAPGNAPAGTRVAGVVSTRDIAATIAAMTGSDSAHVFPGKSLARFWSEGAVATDTAIAQLDSDDRIRPLFPAARGDMDAVVTPEYHLIRDGRGDLDLFDLRSDPLEMRDLSATEGARVVLNAFTPRMRSRELSGGDSTLVRNSGARE
jgi:arylsulfatase A-like enzyme